MRVSQKTVALLILFIFLFVVGTIIATRTVAYLEAGMSGSELKGFLVEVIAYVVALTGWLFLFIYSFMKGDFKDIEGPKYEILEMEEKIIKAEKEGGKY
jgi:FtsH-binding integral membrane protein